MPSASRQLAQEVLGTALDERERNLLRTASHSIERAVGLYGRNLGGREGVEREVARIKRKVEDALAERVKRVERAGAVRDVEQVAAEVAGEERPLAPERTRTGVPSGAGGALSVPAASMKDAGAVASSRDDPPVTAPAVLSESPAPRVSSPRLQRGPSRQDALQVRVLELLRAQRMTSKRLAAELGTEDRAMKSRMMRMHARGLVERTPQNAYDWPGGCRPGRPGRVWRAAEGERDDVLGPLRPAASSPVKSRSGAYYELARNGDVQSKPFDPVGLWEGLTFEERRELMLVVLGSPTFGQLVRSVEGVAQTTAVG